jgi:hypothetical protein
MLRTRITLERVLRLNEILVGNLNAQLETLSEAQLQRQRNEEAVEKQMREAREAAQNAGPEKRNKPADAAAGQGQQGE